MKLIHCIIVTTALTFVAITAAAAPPPGFLVGEWSLETQTDPHMGGRLTRSTLEFAMDDGELTGMLSANNVEKPLEDITYVDGTLRFTVATLNPGQKALTRLQRRNIGPTRYYEVDVRDEGWFQGFMHAFFGAAQLTGVKAGSGARPPEVVTLPQAAARPDGEAFTWLREEEFSIGGQNHTVQVYRSNLFAAILGLGPGETDIAAEFILVPAGTFMMGSSKEVQAQMARARAREVMLEDESPRHRVNVKPFLLARTEVTQRIWRGLAHLAGLPREPWFYDAGDRAPVEQISWHDAKQWLQGINDVYDLNLRLPTEAEWEYACRAGTTTPYYNGTFPGPDRRKTENLEDIAWYIGNSGVYPGVTQPVGGKLPNAFGLYDMLGNVLEWVEDIAHPNYEGAPTDGSAWTGGEYAHGTLYNGPMTAIGPLFNVRDRAYVPGRVRRGGSIRNLTYNTRAAMRSFRGPNFTDSNSGFRVAASAPERR